MLGEVLERDTGKTAVAGSAAADRNALRSAGWAKQCRSTHGSRVPLAACRRTGTTSRKRAARSLLEFLRSL